MARPSTIGPRNIPIPKTLEERIFFLFPDGKFEAVAEIAGISRPTVHGWKAGKSRPTLAHLEAIAQATRVDMNWLLTGKTNSIEAITYAYFPNHVGGEMVARPEIYEEARHFSGWAMAPWNAGEHPKMAHAVAVLWRAAVDGEAPDPIPRYELEGQPDEGEFIDYCARTPSTPEYEEKVGEIIARMRTALVIDPVVEAIGQAEAPKPQGQADESGDTPTVAAVEGLLAIARDMVEDIRATAEQAEKRAQGHIDALERILAELRSKPE